MKTQKIEIYDTTLRDGTQGMGISFTMASKVRVAEALNEMGVHYIEGGWPGSNPKDIEFFKVIKDIPLSNARIAAFGSTRRANVKVAHEDNVIKLIEVETPVVTIFGKSWTLHVTDVLKVDYKENLKMIYDTVKFLKGEKREVFYDAEHFFDGFKEDPEYALETLQAAHEAGADRLVLCDTNGGTMPDAMLQVIKKVRERFRRGLGVHIHNDSGVAVANSCLAVTAGAMHVQGTINGYGERAGNADLCSIIPNLKIKMGIDCITDAQLALLVQTSRFIDELANLKPNSKLPYVGSSAFAHKGGMHVNAVQKNPRTFEHMDPSLIGAKREILVSELSGKSNILIKASEYGISLHKDEINKVLKKLKEYEHKGYEFEAAEGSFELLIRKTSGSYKKFFDLEGFRVIIEKREDGRMYSEATIKVNVNGQTEHTAAEGDGPVNALDNALRKALEKFYPQLADMSLADFKVRVLDAKAGTAAKVRVLIESSDRKRIWGTVGVSENIIEASWEALVDSIEYKLIKEKE
ncbi:MAG: citramalate synthase [Candidatus Aureabacteria bacterium]|nr:citramalate synthase [Candidatus Auribacterota bacterium]